MLCLRTHSRRFVQGNSRCDGVHLKRTVGKEMAAQINLEVWRQDLLDICEKGHQCRSLGNLVNLLGYVKRELSVSINIK